MRNLRHVALLVRLLVTDRCGRLRMIMIAITFCRQTDEERDQNERDGSLFLGGEDE